MKISLIITVYNRFEYIENILKCIINQSVQPYEVIFTDDGSKEDLKEILKKYKDKVNFKMKHIFQKDLGFRKAKACNNAEKEEGSHDIEFNLKEPIAGEWEKQVIRYSQLKTEIIEKLGEYVEFITISNTEHPEIEKIDELLKGFQKCDF